MKKIRKNVAGIDIGTRHVFVGIESNNVKQFETFTEDFEQLAKYLLENKIESVAIKAYEEKVLINK